jgi:predicted PurR-regulated permease PerM
VLTDAPPKRVSRSQVNAKTIWVAGLVLLALLTCVVVLLRASLAWMLLLISAYLAAALNHPVEWLSRHMKRGLAIAIVMVAWLALAVGVVFLFVPPLVTQVQALIDEAPKLWHQVQSSHLWTSLQDRFHLTQKLKSLGSNNAGKLGGVVAPVVTAVTGVVKLGGGLVSIYFLVLFMLTSGGPLVRGLIKETSPSRRERYAKVVSRVYHAIGGYVLGLMVIVAINAVLTSIFLGLIGVPFYLPLGVLSGLGSVLPMIGATVAGGLIIVVALATGGIWHGVAALAYYVAYQMFENHVISPVVYRRTVNVNPLVLLGGLLVFAELGGLVAAVISVPVIATGQIVLQEVLQARRERLGMPPPEEVEAPHLIHRGDVPEAADDEGAPPESGEGAPQHH